LTCFCRQFCYGDSAAADAITAAAAAASLPLVWSLRMIGVKEFCYQF